MIVFNIVLLFTSISNTKKYLSTINILNSKILIDQELYKSLKEKMFKSLLYEGYELENYVLNDNDKKHLILRYPKLACNTCMDSLLVNLSKMYTAQELFNIILLVDGSNDQYLNEVKRLYKFIIPNIVETDTHNQVLPLDELNVPYFFILDDKNKCHMIFIPEKDKVEDIRRYILLTKKVLFK